ncbi:M23 family metallopeptidase [Streptomyces sp. P38-E01]|uniref:M23 family metallopeptidase n=1 Tax=Streptomyces tardus TaxID=2780544 RepID=A0A949N885_9ACTN|nr:M23 family metallopeptidase [Streptomyces tardus]MBU7597678.1 M23 family metallopeptidase [Streptomyces tardus]
MVLVFPRPSRPYRLSAAFLGALLLSPLTGGPASAAPATVPAAGPPPQRTQAASRPSPGASPEIGGLYRKAAAASRQHERTRRSVDRQRATTERLTTALTEKRRQYASHRRALGAAAAMQYRSGVGPEARLVLARSPEEFLTRSASLRQGNRAGVRMMHEADRARTSLDRQKRAARTALKKLHERQREQLRIKQSIQAQLVRAEHRVARRAAARQRAAQQLEAAGQGGPATRTAEPARPEPLHVSHRSGCPSGAAPASSGRSGGWARPVNGGYTLTAGFAAQGGRWASNHTGQDFAVPTGTPVRSVGDGVVARTGCGDSYGVQVVVRHSGGYHTQYAHLSLLQVEAGQRVKAGQQLGLSGSTGNSSGPHLHFEVRVTEQSGSAVSPLPWLRERGVRV